MPQEIATLVWVVGGGVIALLLSVIAFLIGRLLSNMERFMIELRDGFASHETRLSVIEVAGCVRHRRKDDGD